MTDVKLKIKYNEGDIVEIVYPTIHNLQTFQLEVFKDVLPYVILSDDYGLVYLTDTCKTIKLIKKSIINKLSKFYYES